jgi:serine/threonine protein phosphatase PrpC
VSIDDLSERGLKISDNGGRQGFYAVYDGHCGAEASTFLESELHERILQTKAVSALALPAAISLACEEADQDFLKFCHKNNKYAGTTALGIFVEDLASMGGVQGALDATETDGIGRLTVFNIGDCQAVLCRKDGVAKELSDSHKPGREDEMERVKRAGGWITEEKDLYMGRVHLMDLSDLSIRERAQEQVTWLTIRRVCGDLAVSRSIGDPDYKGFQAGVVVDDFLFNFPEDHPKMFTADLVIPDPEITQVALLRSDEFVVLASDGLWDVVLPQEAVDIARAALMRGETTEEVALFLCRYALRLGSSDNVTVVVVLFKH